MPQRLDIPIGRDELLLIRGRTGFQYHSGKDPIWQRLVRRYCLLDYSFDATVSWPFGEAILNIEYDVMSDTTKSRRYGFLEWVDMEEMLFRLFTQFPKMRFIPALRE